MAVDVREALADYAHEAWSGWMRYLFDKSIKLADGGVLVPPPAVARWQRQMETPYAQLPDHEKDSDLTEADRMLLIMREHRETR